MSSVRIVRWLALALLAIGGFAAPSVQTAQAASSSTGCLPGVLRARLSQIRSKFGSIRVVSTHRPGARIAGSGRRSLHSSCRAVDFVPPRGKYGAVVAWLKANHGGGVGTYSCGMHHVHIDSGPRVRFHHCVSASGRPIRSARRGSKGRRYASRRTRSGNRYATRRGNRYAAWRGTRSSLGVGRRTRGRGTRTRVARSGTRPFETRRYLRSVTRNGA